jgi:hypothetical protein
LCPLGINHKPGGENGSGEDRQRFHRTCTGEQIDQTFDQAYDTARQCQHIKSTDTQIKSIAKIGM